MASFVGFIAKGFVFDVHTVKTGLWSVQRRRKVREVHSFTRWMFVYITVKQSVHSPQHHKNNSWHQHDFCAGNKPQKTLLMCLYFLNRTFC